MAGPSGSGKTAMLLLLAGLEQPTAGHVSLDGVRLDTLDRDALADLRRDRIGIVFQSFHLLPSLTALDNVALPLQIAGRADALPRARDMLARVGLGARGTHYPAQLSGGEQQRVAIARALVHRPRLLLADEPTGNLDDGTGAAVRELLFELNRDSGATLVLVTHDLGIRRALRPRCCGCTTAACTKTRARMAPPQPRRAMPVPFLLSLAWRDLRASGRTLWVFCACLALGVALVAAGGGLYGHVSGSLLTQARALFGGDLMVWHHQPLSADEEAWLRARGTVSRSIELRTMLRNAEGRAQLVELQAADAQYPLVGRLIGAARPPRRLGTLWPSARAAGARRWMLAQRWAGRRRPCRDRRCGARGARLSA